MTDLRTRHLTFAAVATTAQEKHLHLVAARKHGEAHLSDMHRRDALAATTMAFDERCGGTVLASDAGFEEGKHPRSDDGKFGSGGGKSSSSGKKSEAQGLTDADHERNKTFKKEGRITHRAGKFSVHHSPAREKRGMAGHGVFEDGVAKGHSAHKTHAEAVAEADHWHHKGTAMPEALRAANAHSHSAEAEFNKRK